MFKQEHPYVYRRSRKSRLGYTSEWHVFPTPVT